MTAIDHAIQNLTKLRDCFPAGSLDRGIVQAELAGFIEVQTGVQADPQEYYGFQRGISRRRKMPCNYLTLKEPTMGRVRIFRQPTVEGDGGEGGAMNTENVVAVTILAVILLGLFFLGGKLQQQISIHSDIRNYGCAAYEKVHSIKAQP